MPDGPTEKRPIVYAGRFADRVAGADLPRDCVVVAEQDAPELAGLAEHATMLVFLDLNSLPLEHLAGTDLDAPVIVALPPGYSAEALAAAFGALFERLGFFDRIVTSDHGLWKELRRKYHWAEGQRVPTTNGRPDAALAALGGLLKAKPASSTKAIHRARAAVLVPRFVAPPRGRREAPEAPRDVLEVGAGSGRWASSFDPAKTRFAALEADGDMLKVARANFPEHRFDLLDPGSPFPHGDESFDLVFSAATMHRHPGPVRKTLLSEMWRVARAGGRLLFLEDFVFTGQDSDTYPVSVNEFQDLILGAAAGQVALEHVESFRYPDEDLRRGGVISLSRLGIPRMRRGQRAAGERQSGDTRYRPDSL